MLQGVQDSFPATKGEIYNGTISKITYLNYIIIWKFQKCTIFGLLTICGDCPGIIVYMMCMASIYFDQCTSAFTELTECVPSIM